MSDLLHLRAVPTTVEFTQGLLMARLVPYNISTRVVDGLPDGRYEVYDEGFRPGAVRRQASSSEPGVLRRVKLRHEHDEDGLGFLGPLMNLDEREDGVYGEFLVMPSKRSDVAALHEVGIREISVEFFENKGGTEVDDDGVRWRTDVQLHAAALLPQGAYGRHGAGVLAMRGLDDLIAEHDADEERKRAEAEAKAQADAAAEVERVEREAAEQAAAARQRELAELDEFLAEATRKQTEYAERLG